jgi:hypothetical protein
MNKFMRILSKVHTQHQATHVWNWIDHQDNPEELWDIMMEVLPWAFYGPSPNHFMFVY